MKHDNQSTNQQFLYSGTTDWTETARILANSPYFTQEDGPINMEIGHRRHPEISTIETFLDKTVETGNRFA